MGQSKIHPVLKAKILECLKQGWPYKEIEERYNVGRSSICYVLRAFLDSKGIKPDKSERKYINSLNKYKYIYKGRLFIIEKAQGSRHAEIHLSINKRYIVSHRMKVRNMSEVAMNIDDVCQDLTDEYRHDISSRKINRKCR